MSTKTSHHHQLTELVPAVTNNLACGQTAQRMSPVSALSNTVDASNHTETQHSTNPQRNDNQAIMLIMQLH